VKPYRYHFGEFILSPRRRLLIRNGLEQPLIPRYFDLLVYLVEHRREAVHRRDIFDNIWRDVIVSDSALSQAIRTIRRTLGDDSREPRFVRTVSRHGYRFVFPDVAEIEEEEVWPEWQTAPDAPNAPHAAASDPFAPLLQLVTRPAVSIGEEEAQREAAELLHELGTSETLRRLETHPGHWFARALLRDTRWDSASAGTVPIFGAPAPVATAAALIRLRLRRVARIVAARWASAAIGGGLAGAIAGAMGGLVLASAPRSSAPIAVVAVLGVIGLCAGALGGAGVAAGVAIAEAVARSNRSLALIACAAAGGGVTGAAVQWLGRWSLATIVGVHIESGGGLEGLVLGAAAGLGYALGTAGIKGGLAAPRGRGRLRVVAVVAVTCGLSALALTLAGRPLVGGTIHSIAQASQGSRAMLTPLGQLIGEPDFGPVTRTVIGMGEGVFFGLGLALGLTRRPKITDISSNAHQSLKT
jgi:DNA-binding winged helix-turn-helix (wHTH) protein